MTDARMISGIEVKPLALFEGLTIENQDFAEYDLRGATFISCIFRNCNFTEAFLEAYEGHERSGAGASEGAEFQTPEEADAIHRQNMKNLYSIESPSPWRETKAFAEEFDLSRSQQTQAAVTEIRMRREALEVEEAATSGAGDLPFVKTVFLNSRVERCDFDNMDLSCLLFQGCEVSASSFRNTVAGGIWFIESKMSKIDIRQADLDEAFFIDSVWMDSSMSSSSIQSAFFAGGEFSSCDFSNVPMDCSEWVAVSLNDCSFSGAKFEEIFGSDVTVAGSTNFDVSKLQELDDEEEDETE